ncbi:MAG: nuclear transport factor 2 family protein [Treponema sp.]|nr:nuclear transport factor 2 family protein [Treponema sp.]
MKLKSIFITSVCAALTAVFAGCACRNSQNQKEDAMTLTELQDRMEIRALVDRYAVESDRFNHEAYREIFSRDITIRQIFEDRTNEIKGIDEVIRIFSASGSTVKVSFHQVGQNYVTFTDDTHANGTTYLTAIFGSDPVSQLFIRYEDKFEKIDGRWWITDRDQYFVYRK